MSLPENTIITYPSFTSSAAVYNSPKAKLAAALVKTQREMGDATKGAKNPFFKSNYADLNAVREAVLPAANNNGLVVLQPIVNYNSKTYVRTLVIHESGEETHSDTEILCVKQNDPQAYGSGISYARRYGLQSFFNVGAVDDDSEKAMGRAAPAKESPPTKAAVKVEPAATAGTVKVEVATVAPVVTAVPVTNPGTESIVAATEAKKSTSFRRPKTEAAAAPAEDWS